jgi:hypothetical protein
MNGGVGRGRVKRAGRDELQSILETERCGIVDGLGR